MKPRSTKAKTLIFQFLQKSKRALSHEALQEELAGSADRATIYRVLNRFCEDGIAHKVTGDDGRQYFALCVDCEKNKHRHNHFHFRCLRCGIVECLPNQSGISLPEGYRPEHFNGFISGYCPTCP